MCSWGGRVDECRIFAIFLIERIARETVACSMGFWGPCMRCEIAAIIEMRKLFLRNTLTHTNTRTGVASDPHGHSRYLFCRNFASQKEKESNRKIERRNFLSKGAETPVKCCCWFCVGARSKYRHFDSGELIQPQMKYHEFCFTPKWLYKFYAILNVTINLMFEIWWFSCKTQTKHKCKFTLLEYDEKLRFILLSSHSSFINTLPHCSTLLVAVFRMFNGNVTAFNTWKNSRGARHCTKRVCSRACEKVQKSKSSFLGRRVFKQRQQPALSFDCLFAFLELAGDRSVTFYFEFHFIPWWRANWSSWYWHCFGWLWWECL